MWVLFFKAMHLIFMVTWFAGLFYLVRLFVYHLEAETEKPEIRQALQKQYGTMQRRLYYIITWPGMVLTVLFGSAMIVANPLYLSAWLYVKLAMVLALVVYHILCGKWMKGLATGNSNLTATHFRLLNEVPTLLLFGIVLLAVFKNLSNFGYFFGGLVVLGILLFVAVRMYKRSREGRKE